MKKIILLLVLMLSFSSIPVSADGSYEEDVLSKAIPWSESSKVTQTGLYKIDVTKESTFEFVFTDPSSSWASMHIEKGAANLVASMQTTWKDNDSSKTIFKIRLKKGTYYASLFNNLKSASYKIVSDVKTDAEPNNRLEDATPVHLNTMIYGRSNGNTSDDDYYKFTLTEPKKITLQLDESFLAMYGDTYGAKLFNENMMILDLDMGYVPISSTYLPVGTYYIGISINLYRGFNKEYQFMVKSSSLPNTPVESITGTTILNNNKTVSGIVSAGGKSDHFQVEHTNENPFVLFTTSTNPLTIGLLKWDERMQFYEETPYTYSPNGTNVWTQELPKGKYQVDVTMDASVRKDIPYSIRYESIRFTDVPTDQPYRSQIERLANEGIINGYHNAQFKPQNSILRKHVFSMLSRIDGFKLAAIRPMKEFKDINDTDSYYEIIKPFYEAGIIDGSGDYMNHESNLTRAQLAKIIVNAFNLQLGGEPIVFNDVKQTDGFYEYIEILASHGITTGSNGNFMPNQPVSRQHFAVFLTRTLDTVN
ncbi:S-layer homology domain-containing protein [Sporosarcina sp. ANT_H38]|uniref:S-layer homology domain-containing protein n=1 Tax=Sporosarcina sp. ANT_H38 TaxID=2597358 RepID=UPI00165E2E02|nr:S-layer homology domain-containing protein [Sporosarcina sp. ANT_H38]